MNLADRLKGCYSSAVHDVLRELGYTHCVLPATIAALVPCTKLAGRIWTFSGYMDYEANDHQTLLEWTGVLSNAPADSVLVCQPNNSEVALMGELSAQALIKRGVHGYIVDGGCRDADFLIDMNFPVFCRFLTPSDIVGRWLPKGLGEPIQIGGVDIKTGDFVLADRDGVVVVPEEIADKAVEQTEQMMATETALRQAIIAGEDPQQAYLKYRVF